MAWTPLDRQQLSRRIAHGLATGDPDLRAHFARIACEPVKWQLHPWGDLGGGFWVVAVLGNRVIWFNDIEDGFQVSTFAEPGVIPTDEYSGDQHELHLAMAILLREDGRRPGPAQPEGA